MAAAGRKLGLDALHRAQAAGSCRAASASASPWGAPSCASPKAFLFDEPLSNLDARLREQMRYEIRKLHRDLGATSVYVTHDQIEAMTMADRIVAMNEGVAQQIGPPADLYDDPANIFVAGFIGSPAMNFLAATLARAKRPARVMIGDAVLAEVPRLRPGWPPGGAVTVGLRARTHRDSGDRPSGTPGHGRPRRADRPRHGGPPRPRRAAAEAVHDRAPLIRSASGSGCSAPPDILLFDPVSGVRLRRPVEA